MAGMRYGSMPRRYASPMGAGRSTGCACAGATSSSDISEANCSGMVLAMAYVLPQPFDATYEPEHGFGRGTLFPDLDKPLSIGGTCRG